MINVRPSAELQRLRYLLLLWNTSDKTGEPPLPSEVYHAANERLMQLMPQVLPNYEQAGPPLPRSMSQEPLSNTAEETNGTVTPATNTPANTNNTRSR